MTPPTHVLARAPTVAAGTPGHTWDDQHAHRLTARARAFPSPPSPRASRVRDERRTGAGARPRPGGFCPHAAARAGRGSPCGTPPGRGGLPLREAVGEPLWAAVGGPRAASGSGRPTPVGGG